MYISIERNNRGSLELEINALNKLIQHSITMSSNTKANYIEEIEVLTDLYHDNFLYVLIKIKLKEYKQMLDEGHIYKVVEEAMLKTLNIKPKNIAIAYSK